MTELDPYRLPREVVPTRYDVTLEPDLTGARFNGTTSVVVNVSSAVAQIVLNAIELDVERVHVDDVAAPFRLDEATERLFIDHPLAAGATATILVTFTGTLNDMLRGFYRSTFVDAQGATQVIATSQMQSTDCRRAFPCWDEPDFKAVFGITLVVDPALTAVSNSPVAEETVRADGKRIVRFADTMVMSSYLVAMIVGPLAVTEPVDAGGTPMRLIHVPGKEHLTAFGLDAGAFFLQWFERFYAIAYPGDKVDMLGLPDFAAGAMENLGAITYREGMLLTDPATATQDELQVVADVVAHELAHMWFGDLVTMRWWNGIWLNEAFATFMEIEAVDAYKPEWKRWESFSLERTRAFEVDSLDNTRPVEFEVRTPQDSEGMFDVLTYQKGASLLRMLQQYLGETGFRDGVRLYLNRHAYANTETGDLWDAIEEATGKPVRRLMDSWIWQPGYPLISASVRDNTLHLSQRRFSFDPNSADQTIFVVPIHVREADGTKHLVLLDGDQLSLPLNAPAGAVIVNAEGFGFFRVDYDATLLSRLSPSVINGLTIVERYSLVDDAWAAVLAGRLTPTAFMTFAEGFADERDSAVWTALALAITQCGRLLQRDDRAGFEATVRRIAGGALAELGVDPVAGEADLTAKLRGQLFVLLGRSGNDIAVHTKARSINAQALAGVVGLDPELVAAATTISAEWGDEALFDTFVDRFRSTTNPQEQLRYLYALAEFDDAALVRRAVEFAFSGEVKSQNAPFLIGRCLANRNHGAMAWAVLAAHWELANERFPTSSIIRMVDGVKLMNEPGLVASVQAFFAEHPIPQAAKTLQQILERQRVSGRLRAEQSDALAKALNAV